MLSVTSLSFDDPTFDGLTGALFEGVLAVFLADVTYTAVLTDSHGTAVVEPFNSHGRVSHRLETTFKVKILPLRNGSVFGQRLHENRFRL
jgi:hypothetical protein